MALLTTDYWLTVGLAAIVGTLFGSITTAWSVTRNIKHKSIIEERQKWRDSLRKLLPEFVACKNRARRTKIRDSIVLRLNPVKDQARIALLDIFLQTPSRSNGNLLIESFQRELKVDWERAKIETSHCPCFAGWRAERKMQKQEMK